MYMCEKAVSDKLTGVDIQGEIGMLGVVQGVGTG